MRMTTMQTHPDDFLQQVYVELEFETGVGCYRLTDPASQPELAQASWLEQASILGAETIFFVGDYPTVLFFKLDVDPDKDIKTVEDEIRQLHLKVWNTSRIPLFFVALPGELRVYSAYQRPAPDAEEWLSKDRWLKQVKTITQIAEKLEEFSRPAIESGRLFHQRSKDFDRENRVDQWLLKNLRLLRQKLEGSNREKREYAHALIGRSIFIRYLEDREVLVGDYFADETISREGDYRCYTDVLGSKEDTYNLFRKLGDDFNGDLFPLSDKEEKAIQDPDLHLLRDFLLGRSMEGHPDLLFWAYKFDIIPTELISNIYEEFYHEHSGDEDKGTHYTPTPLVDFVLSQCLTIDRLDAGARVLDPACGSGIFLVEAFKRMVHHECRRRGIDRLPRDELTELLTERLVGIDINKSAIQVAAFSLYLTYLDFLEPRDIRAHKQLPKLGYDPEQPESGRNLFHANAFYVTPTEQLELEERLKQHKRYKGRIDDARVGKQPVLPLKDFKFDVIVGNPPWGTDDSSDNQLAAMWCKAFRYPVGYEELSQCFVWRVQQLLKPDGEIGLLVSTGLFFKHEDNSRLFRQRWLEQNRVRAVYNFAHVRRIFFQEATAPFAAVFFAPERSEETLQNIISYVSVKRSAFAEQLQAIIIDRTDLHKVYQSDFLANDWLWKAYMWGNSNDVEMIGELKSCYRPLRDFVDDSGRGYEARKRSTDKHTDELGVSLELPTSSFSDQSPLSRLLQPIEPRKIGRLGNLRIYTGPRLLVKRGISRSKQRHGDIQARLATESFAFKHSIYGFRVDSLTERERKILLAIMLSSLARYYYFLTCSMWGLWHDEIHKDEHLQLPIRFPKSQDLQNRIIAAVEAITTPNDSLPFLNAEAIGSQTIQNELDEAIFELYELSESQKDLVRDLCQITLEFFYEGVNSQAVTPPPVEWLEEYRDAFLEIWDERLASKGKELEPRITAPRFGLLVGMSFELKDLGTAVAHNPTEDNSEWQHWFRRLGKLLMKEHSTRIYIDRVVKVLSASEVFIIKRAERRFWTKSQARQDAQELLTEVFQLEWQANRSLV